MYKIIGGDGKEYGPIDSLQLKQWIKEGRVSAQTQALLEGTAEWKPLGSFEEFAPGFAPAASAMPSMPAMPSPTRDAASRVSGPAIGLMVTAILALILVVLNLVLTLSGVSTFQPRTFGQSAEIAKFARGTGLIIGVVLAVAIYGTMLLGAIKMKKLQSYGMAMTACILGLLPCSLCCVVGLPFGIWGLVVLNKPEVKAAFQ